MAKKFHEFDVGCAGRGAIDLATGTLTFMHQTTDAESSILPIVVSHVYQSDLLEKSDKLYGRGWKLNLNQNLRKVLPDDPNDTRHIYTDGSGIEHEFEEKYFYRKDKKKVFYLPNTTTKIRRSDIKIDQDSRMWLIKNPNIEIFADLVTDSGLILRIRPKGFEGSKKLEMRHEELVRVENEIKNIKRQIEDLEEQIRQSSELEKVAELKLEDVKTIQDLQKHIEHLSQQMERESLENFDKTKGYQEELIDKQKELRSTTEKTDDVARLGGFVPERIVAQTNITRDIINTNTSFGISRVQNRDVLWTPIDQDARAAESIQNRVQWQSGVDTTNTATNENPEPRLQGRRIQAAAYFQRRFNDKCEKIQRDIQKLSTNIEESNWKNQKNSMEDRSTLFTLQENFQIIKRDFQDARHQLMMARWNEDLIDGRVQLARREHLRKQLIDWLPVNYIISDNILGFNEIGNLVLIFDNYDNQVSIMYENDRIVRVVDSENRAIVFEYIANRLDHIKDFQDRKTYFKYDLKNRLKEIIYPDRQISTFTYNNNNMLQDVMPPSKIGQRLEFDYKNRVTQIINRSATSKISSSGVQSGTAHNENFIEFLYDALSTYTIVSNLRTQEQVTYFFNDDSEIIHEYIQGKFESHLITTYDSDDYEISINEEIMNENYVSEYKKQHLKWATNPDSLPSFREKLTWQITELDAEDNPIRITYGETALASDRNIRQKIEETFSYRHFRDGRQPLLIKSETIITTTDRPIRNSSEEYLYNSQGDLILTISEPSGMIEETGYSSEGVVVNSIVYHKDNSDQQFVDKNAFNEEGQLISSYDESGQYKTTYSYIQGTNRIKKTTDPRENHTVFGYDSVSNNINTMSSVANGERNGITYGYTADFLTKLESANTKVEYIYDNRGRLIAIYLNDESKAYVTYKYSTEMHDPNNKMGVLECDVITTTYSNGEVFKSFTDILGRLLSIHYKTKTQSERIILTNFYDDDKVIETLDYRTNETITFEYDEEGNIVKQVIKGLFDEKMDDIPCQHLSVSHIINIDGVLEKSSYKIDNRNQDYGFTYDNEILSQIKLPNNDVLKINSDTLGRVQDVKVVTKEEKEIIREKLSFLQYSNQTTNIVNSHTYIFGDGIIDKIHYNYDENGNIKEIKELGQVVLRYKYDELNRLVREDNKKLDKSIIFEYDNNGNILFKRDFQFTLGELSEGTLTRYMYLNNNDQLTSYNNEKFEYDILGNPIIYRNKELKWSHTRELEIFDDIEFKYNATGLRVYKDYQKEVEGNTTRFETRYQWYKGKLVSETMTSTTNNWMLSDNSENLSTHDLIINTSNTTIDYIYSTNNIIGFTLDNEFTYYYVKNIQGDVMKIIDNNGNVVAEYNYDAWGNHEIIMNVDGIAELNPIRYRSYYYDNQTGLYYLKSRYYDAQVGRFVNMDDISILDVSQNYINGLNLYAYCFNNPVMMSDDDGNFARLFRAVATFVVAVAIVAAVVVTAGAIAPVLVGTFMGAGIGGGFSIVNQLRTTGSINWGSVFKSAMFGAVSGALAASGLGAVGLGFAQGGVGFASSVATDWISGNSIDWTGALITGAISGVMAGGIAGVTRKAGVQSVNHKKTGLLATKRQNQKNATNKVKNNIRQGLYSKRGAVGANNLTRWHLKNKTRDLSRRAVGEILNPRNFLSDTLKSLSKNGLIGIWR